MYLIGQLAKESEPTVRTLRYYDEIGLLKPSLISEGGHRYYEEHDFIKLHSIRIYELAQKVWAKHKNSNGKIGMYQIDPAIGSFVEKAIGYYMSRRLL